MNGYALALGPALLAGAGVALLVLPHRVPVLVGLAVLTLVLGATTILIRHVSTQPPTPETALPVPVDATPPGT